MYPQHGDPSAGAGLPGATVECCWVRCTAAVGEAAVKLQGLERVPRLRVPQCGGDIGDTTDWEPSAHEKGVEGGQFKFLAQAIASLLWPGLTPLACWRRSIGLYCETMQTSSSVMKTTPETDWTSGCDPVPSMCV